MDNRMTPEAMDDYLRTIEHLMQTAKWARPVLYDIPHPSVLDAKARQRLTDLLTLYRETIGKHTLGYALVTPSATVRGILTAIFWISPPPYRHKVFGNTRAAFEWLGPLAPKVDTQKAYVLYEGLKARMLPKLDAAQARSA